MEVAEVTSASSCYRREKPIKSERRKHKARERKCSSSPKVGCSAHQCKRPLKARCQRDDEEQRWQEAQRAVRESGTKDLALEGISFFPGDTQCRCVHIHPGSDEVRSPPALSLSKLLLWNTFTLLLTGSTDL